MLVLCFFSGSLPSVFLSQETVFQDVFRFQENQREHHTVHQVEQEIVFS